MAAFRSQGQKGVAGHDVADQSSWPLTDYTAPKPTDPEKRARREARGKKYDKSNFRVHPEDPAENTVRTQPFDPSATVPALPVMLSNAVVIGEVTAAQAYLSSDQTGVYSEFNIRVEDVLKTDGSQAVATGCQIDLEREGGRVRFPSGLVHWYSVDKENMPLTGRRYVFFLTRESQEQPFHILTAYEFRDAKVFPLDELRQFKSHGGENELDFLSTLRALVTVPSKTGNEK
ncbi:MAG TPA: hypothetical protein VGO56_06775 [Pyrinomonadaceae bacterium]|nr:hypothetical protein [Pyrinomonadaceae bacterium]